MQELRPDARKDLQERFADRAAAAFRVLDDIATDPAQPPPQRVSAAKHILALAGFCSSRENRNRSQCKNDVVTENTTGATGIR